MSARRAAKGKRWSATSSVRRLDASGNVVASNVVASKAIVNYRYDAKSRKKTFIGPRCTDDAQAFQNLLVVAYDEDWPADAQHRPIPPTPLPTPQPIMSAPPLLLSLPDEDRSAVDIVTVCDWFLDRMRSTPKRRGGQKRKSASTTHKPWQASGGPRRPPHASDTGHRALLPKQRSHLMSRLLLGRPPTLRCTDHPVGSLACPSLVPWAWRSPSSCRAAEQTPRPASTTSGRQVRRAQTSTTRAPPSAFYDRCARHLAPRHPTPSSRTPGFTTGVAGERMMAFSGCRWMGAADLGCRTGRSRLPVG